MEKVDERTDLNEGYFCQTANHARYYSSNAMSLSLSPQALSAEPTAFAPARLVATDMDGTLTKSGAFTRQLFEAFEQLAQQDIPVMIVTGRSAGWVSALVHYFPVVGAIAENGGLYIEKSNPTPLILPDIPRMSHHRNRLETIFNRLKARYPDLCPSVDNPYRLTDWTFDIAGLSQNDLAWMTNACESLSMGFTYSTVQCHIKVRRQNKADGLCAVLAKKFPHVLPAQVVTVGDSPNDESLFDRDRFPLSVGVANVSDYLPMLAYQPAYITQNREVEGFQELVNQLANR